MIRILDRRFKYVPARQTDVAATFRRLGFKPTSAAQRRNQQAPKAQPVEIAAARALRVAKR